MRAFLKFNKGALKLPVPVQLWMVILVTANMVVPMFFLDRLEAQAIFATFLVSATLMILLTARFGFTRIMGLGHILMIPLLGWLAFRLGQIPADDIFGFWIRGVMLVNGLSLVMDAVDVVRYFNGDREELVQGL